jgi:ubiquinone/menaquinone biosynthesis C-methylase UbiE
LELEGPKLIRKPPSLGSEFGRRFEDPTVADAYLFRPLYPPETFEILMSLLTEKPFTVLDVGCGLGNIARHIVNSVETVDAIDSSAEMIRRGMRLQYGDSPKLRWIVGRAEDAPLSPPYALITAGQSLHWMDWNVIFNRLHDVLTVSGKLAIVDLDEEVSSQTESLQSLIREFSTNRDFQPYDMISELQVHGLFEKLGDKKTASTTFTQTVNEYLEALHSRSSLTRNSMGSVNATKFDERVTDVLLKSFPERRVKTKIFATVVWGKPMKH